MKGIINILASSITFTCARLHSGAPALIRGIKSDVSLFSQFNDITSNCKFSTWRPVGCRRGRSRSSRGALRPQTLTCVSTNTRCSSLSDEPLTSGRRDTSARRLNEVGSPRRFYTYNVLKTYMPIGLRRVIHYRGCYTDIIAALFFIHSGDQRCVIWCSTITSLQPSGSVAK